jgi:hypothetical protein
MNKDPRAVICANVWACEAEEARVRAPTIDVAARDVRVQEALASNL